MPHFPIKFAIQGIMKWLKAEGVVFEPAMVEERFMGSEVIRDLAALKARADLVAEERLALDLADITDRVFTRDMFGAD